MALDRQQVPVEPCSHGRGKFGGGTGVEIRRIGKREQCVSVEAEPNDMATDSRHADLDRRGLNLVRELLVILVELRTHELERLLAELWIRQLVEHRVDRGLGATAEQQLRHHSARADRAGADLFAQRRLGLTILEFPVHFPPRQYGTSNFTGTLRMKYKNILRTAKYIVGMAISRP